MKKAFLSFVLLSMMIVACQSPDKTHFIHDKVYRHRISSAFDSLQQILEPKMPQLFKQLQDSKLSPMEQEAMQFLYVSMPLSDIINRPPSFYIRQMRAAFATKELFPWADTLPNDVFRHFVLPYRVNNENMDSARMVFQRELYPRIKDMSMAEAALEVNHWCHEKVNYRATDSRTIGPLSAIKTAYGRCGEESTFTVTALRAVGIPARQVYTPRWAHTDDNHAWVEAYVDGRWQYMGACEPKPVLNTAWFDEPVLRAMMVHTKAFGNYHGSEAVIAAHNKYSILHLLNNYVPVRNLEVQVVDKADKAVPNANIAFGLYNYAEFYPLKQMQTDAHGKASLLSGLGTLRVMASDAAGHFNTVMVNLADTGSYRIKLDKNIGESYNIPLKHIPPVQKLPKAVPTDQEAANNIRLAQEDSIRNAYIDTFDTIESARAFLSGYRIDDEELANILVEARGNARPIKELILRTHDGDIDQTINLLKSLSTKDYHDISYPMLKHHYDAFAQNNKQLDKEIARKYVCSPRIALEEISAYRAPLQARFADLANGDIAEVSAALQSWIETHISIDNQWNYYNIYMHPEGVCQAGVADERSRDLLYVAAMRSLGYPARIEQARHKPQYYDRSWIDVNFSSAQQAASPAPKAQLSIVYHGGKPQDPLYRIHFGLAKFNGAFFETLEYDWEKPLSQFEDSFEVEAGYYQLITGNRLHNGEVLVRQQYFNIEAGAHKQVELHIPSLQIAHDSIGKWLAYGGGAPMKQGYEILGWIDPHTEPGKHFLADFKPWAKQYADSHQPLKLYVPRLADVAVVQQAVGKAVTVVPDPQMTMLSDMYKAIGYEEEALMLPVFVVITADGSIRLHTKGYNIGTPEQLLKYTDLLKQGGQL